ncbi:MAG: hypothetical protein M4579_004434 [Chaenotheca gracillima]|nr:MAG: hypothetical protein M4579_004434 [Chaenotheca gracillima]
MGQTNFKRHALLVQQTIETLQSRVTKLESAVTDLAIERASNAKVNEALASVICSLSTPSVTASGQKKQNARMQKLKETNKSLRLKLQRSRYPQDSLKSSSPRNLHYSGNDDLIDFDSGSEGPPSSEEEPGLAFTLNSSFSTSHLSPDSRSPSPEDDSLGEVGTALQLFSGGGVQEHTQVEKSGVVPFFQGEYVRFFPTYDDGRLAETQARGQSSFEVSSQISKTLPTLDKSWNGWGSEAQRSAAIRINSSSAGFHDLRFPDFFRHGLLFKPKEDHDGVYRAVVITGLCSTVTAKDVLEHVRGGAVLSCRMMDTVSITGFKSAIITFVRSFSAVAFSQFMRGHALEPSGLRAQVTLLSTPTYPIAANQKKAVFDDHHTRCLLIRSTLGEISASAMRNQLETHSAIHWDTIETMEARGAEQLLVRFTSISAASSASARLARSGQNRHLRVTFYPDPCATPLDSAP